MKIEDMIWMLGLGVMFYSHFRDGWVGFSILFFGLGLWSCGLFVIPKMKEVLEDE